MSTLSQKKYIEHLKLIKEAEDKVQTEIEAHRKLIEEEINHLQEEFESTIAVSKVEGKKIIEKSIEQARDNATKEANKIINDAETKSKTISFPSDPQIIKNIIEILLSGIER
jgi:V/A-type H+-transporting ATPase subunit G/H